jgi:Mlc titration factor MtfA (ptsG expression regulator)
LSWADAERTGEEAIYNVVIHEFAHKLDMLNGEANGFPPLHADMSRERWSGVFTSAYERFCVAVDTDCELELDDYAAESPAEFFAVMSEAFFEAPAVVRRAYPDVYHQLTQFYRQDPAARLDVAGASAHGAPR